MPSVYEIVTEKIIKQLESGVAPWRKPWTCQTPANLLTQKEHRGLNVFTPASQGFPSRFWLTFNQTTKLGGRIRKGEKSSPVIFWNVGDEREIDSDLLARIIERLYPPQSPYRFDVIGVELLGSIYERYLGDTIRVTAKRVFVEQFISTCNDLQEHGRHRRSLQGSLRHHYCVPRCVPPPEGNRSYGPPRSFRRKVLRSNVRYLVSDARISAPRGLCEHFCATVAMH